MISSAGGLTPVTDSGALKRAYGCFPTGVVAVCTRTADLDENCGTGELIGMAASAFTTVSLDPPLVSVCVQKTSTTWPALRDAPAIGVSVFAHDQAALCRQLAGPAPHRFTGIDPLATDAGAVFIPAAAAHLSCRVYAEVDAGDHILALFEIEALRSDPDVEPLVFHASTFRVLEARAAPTGAREPR
ncbi:MAG: flavin reductase family protein [Gordonia sp. (in: high G+C Gram-positive bacteria)]